MKFKYTGKSGTKDLDLVLYGLMTPDEELINGMVFEVPDTSKDLIKRIKTNGNYVIYHEPRKPVVKKSKKKEEKKEEDDKEE